MYAPQPHVVPQEIVKNVLLGVVPLPLQPSYPTRQPPYILSEMACQVKRIDDDEAWVSLLPTIEVTFTSLDMLLFILLAL